MITASKDLGFSQLDWQKYSDKQFRFDSDTAIWRIHRELFEFSPYMLPTKYRDDFRKTRNELIAIIEDATVDFKKICRTLDKEEAHE